MIPLRFAYLIATLIFTVFYGIVFLLRKDARVKMLRLSMYGSVVGPLSQLWYLKDYWQPGYVFKSFTILEDTLCAAVITGMAGGIINLLLNVESKDAGRYGNKRSRHILAMVIGISVLFVFSSLLKLNSLYASVLAFFILALFIFRERPDLLKPGLVGASFWLVFLPLGYNIVLLLWPSFFREFWLLRNISGIFLLNIPLEEYAWFICFGLVGSVIFEWKRGYAFIKKGAV